MSDYRLYLIQNGHVLMGQHYPAPTDTDAIIIGTAVARACNDIVPTIEIWEGSRTIFESSSNAGKVQLKLTQHHREIITDLEERLYESHAALGRSRKLLTALETRGGSIWDYFELS